MSGQTQEAPRGPRRHQIQCWVMSLSHTKPSSNFEKGFLRKHLESPWDKETNEAFAQSQLGSQHTHTPVSPCWNGPLWSSWPRWQIQQARDSHLWDILRNVTEVLQIISNENTWIKPEVNTEWCWVNVQALVSLNASWGEWDIVSEFSLVLPAMESVLTLRNFAQLKADHRFDFSELRASL